MVIRAHFGNNFAYSKACCCCIKMRFLYGKWLKLKLCENQQINYKIFCIIVFK